MSTAQSPARMLQINWGMVDALAQDFGGEQFAPHASEGIPRIVLWREAALEMPDDETSVMVFCPENNEPVWIGFHEDGKWRCPSGAPLVHRVTHWAHLPEPPTAR